jgi:hypothetical protein
MTSGSFQDRSGSGNRVAANVVLAVPDEPFREVLLNQAGLRSFVPTQTAPMIDARKNGQRNDGQR